VHCVVDAGAAEADEGDHVVNVELVVACAESNVEVYLGSPFEDEEAEVGEDYEVGEVGF